MLKKIIIIGLIICCIGAIQSEFVNAAENSGNVFEKAQESLGTSGKKAYGENTQSDLPTVVGNVINGFLLLIGIVLTVIVLRGGIKYMLAGGNEEEVTKAKRWIINGIIGLVIVLLAFAISSFVIDRLVTATTTVSLI